MVMTDEDALICDMAETYGVFDFYSLPAPLAATLAVGLRDDSRIKIKLSGMKIDQTLYLIAALFDKVNWLCWTKTEDAQRGVNMPKRIIERLTEADRPQDETDDDYLVFDSPEAFEAERQRLLGEINDG